MVSPIHAPALAPAIIQQEHCCSWQGQSSEHRGSVICSSTTNHINRREHPGQASAIALPPNIPATEPGTFPPQPQPPLLTAMGCNTSLETVVVWTLQPSKQTHSLRKSWLGFIQAKFLLNDCTNHCRALFTPHKLPSPVDEWCSLSACSRLRSRFPPTGTKL